MHKASLLFCTAALACTVSVSAHAQATTPESPFSRVLSRVDLGVSGAGMFTHTVTGPILPHEAPDFGSTVEQQTSNTLGAVVTIRYQHRPWLGVEFNGSYARYTENFITAAPNQVQTRASEYSFGYVARPQFTIFDLNPYFGVGAGTLEFKPTGHGGQGQQTEGRFLTYYSVGVQKDINSFLGLRAGLRQIFFLDPDFNVNYLTINKRTYTVEPTAGFYIKF